MKTHKTKHIRLHKYITPTRYQILLKPDLENFTFYGEETIELGINKSTKEITLHATELAIDSAEFIYRGKDVLAGKISYNEQAETVTLAFPRTIPPGRGELKLTFRGILNDKMRGFYRSRYVVDGKERYLATTQFEAVDARRAFPAFDEPDKKAIFDITFMIRAHLTAISNTIPTAVSEHEGGYKTVAFAPTPRMSTYLVAFIIGEFEHIEAPLRERQAGAEKTLVRVFTTPGKKEQARFALSVAVKCLEFYEDYFGIVYPLPVLDLIAISDFAYGAMENWGAVTYRESTILIDEELSSSANKQWVALVIAHELAHQWFGNLVTMEWWTHLWLNEGFASYIEYLAIDHIFPKWDIWTQFVFLEQGTALKLDALKTTHPIEVEVNHPSEINEIFDKVSYSKGASVIRMLAEYLGSKDFRAGLSHYLKKHNYANAKTSDLWIALSEVSGKDVAKIMANWTGKAGYPLITLKDTRNGFALSQSRFFSSQISRKQSRDKTQWLIPVKIREGTPQKRGMGQTKKSYILTKKSQTFPKGKALQKVNADEVSFLRVSYPSSYFSHFASLIVERKLPVVDRLGIIRDAFALSESGQLDTIEALTLVQSYKGERDYAIWVEISSSLRQIANLFSFETFYSSYEAFCQRLFFSVVKHVGWKKQANEGHTQTLLRTLALYNFGSFGDKETIARAKNVFTRLRKGETVDPDLRSVVYNLVAENGAEAEHEAFTVLYKKEELQQEKERIGRALALFREHRFLKKTLAFSLSPNVRSQAINGIVTAVWGNPYGRDVAWEFVKEHWTLFKDRLGGGHLLSRLLTSASDFTMSRKASEIEIFFKKHKTPEATRTITQVIEQIYANEARISKDREALRAFLKKV